MEHWCFRCRNDETEEGCPFVLVAMLGQTPAEWQEVEPLSLGNQYSCPEFAAAP
jgi:hypothetical protein